eukprot:14318696-Alexandrium_andersonii.AAC.1
MDGKWGGKSYGKGYQQKGKDINLNVTVNGKGETHEVAWGSASALHPPAAGPDLTHLQQSIVPGQSAQAGQMPFITNSELQRDAAAFRQILARESA